MKELIDELQATTRGVGTGKLPAGDAQVVSLSRRFPADPEDVWDAITTPERIARWFLPVTGDLRLGGTYQLEGNAGGEIRACDPPRRLELTWIMGEPEGPEDSSIVEVVLDPDGDGGTTLSLTHTAVVPPEFWDTYGPGAVGVGWDIAILSLAHHVAGEDLGPAEDVEQSPEMRTTMTASSEAWGRAHRDAGADDETAAKATAATTAFYVPPE